jgi:beta-glucosidase
VLLKNEENILPLKKDAKIAVVGEIASNRDEMFGAWAVCPDFGTAVSLVDGLKNAGVDFVYEKCVGEKEPLDKELLAETVKDADVVIAAISYHDAGEAHSDCMLEVKGQQVLMLEELRRMGKKVVTVLFNGRPLALGNLVPNTDALVEAWHLGSETGDAVCDVLFGDYNPSGRLTATFQYHSGQWPVYYSHTNTGRPTNESEWTCKYRDAPLFPLYCFGYGLSYTEFEYSNLRLEKDGEELKATVTVKNIGDMAGEETVQLYIHRRNATRVRPVKELKGYAKAFLQPGEEKEVTITVSRDLLGYFDMNAEYVTDESEFDIWMAHDSTCELGCHQVIEF